MTIYTITKETSPYNKYMKWLLTGINDGKEIVSMYFRTKKEAEEKIKRFVDFDE